MSDPTPRVVIYDRGMLDRLPWIDFSVNEGSIPARDAFLLKQLLSQFMEAEKENIAEGARKIYNY